MGLSHHDKICKLARAVIQVEANAVISLSDQINDKFVLACQLMMQCKGRIVVTGMGKSGHIAGKIAATLASTGTPAFFVHSGEASHGDLGMITPQDVVLALSNSGETSEILTILPIIKRLDVPLIALSGNPSSTLAKFATVHLNVAVKEEACPLGLAPTSSTTAALVMGDALAVSLLETKGFTRDDFAFSHPAGSLGKGLLLRVSDLMHTGHKIPKVKDDALIIDALVEMTAKNLGMTAIVDEQNHILGVFTDGDVRRMLGEHLTPATTKITDVMTQNCIVISNQILAAEAMRIMEKKEINALLVTDNNQCLIGALNIHDLIHSGIV
ncbi:MAG: KpsF/GutQ family sugar-phosphate isomerase [Methylococcales bacterium]|nr:KpsF/GutQ family sugar-phosphate isomerase [Methylococcales bacterium]